jgi:hypothetical protein
MAALRYCQNGVRCKSKQSILPARAGHEKENRDSGALLTAVLVAGGFLYFMHSVPFEKAAATGQVQSPAVPIVAETVT